jgi:hypothetical protein
VVLRVTVVVEHEAELMKLGEQKGLDDGRLNGPPSDYLLITSLEAPSNRICNFTTFMKLLSTISSARIPP